MSIDQCKNIEPKLKYKEKDVSVYGFYWVWGGGKKKGGGGGSKVRRKRQTEKEQKEKKENT